MIQDPKAARTVLPIPERRHVGLTTYDAKDPNTRFPAIEALRPPAGAPNVVVLMIDDCGFGAASAFGGPCRTPNIEKLAANGLSSPEGGSDPAATGFFAVGRQSPHAP